MLWTILLILLVLWLLGVIGSIGGGFIHLLLVLAIVVFVAQLLTSRNSSV
jgi:K+-transporting ATPase A subunit